MTVKKRPGDLTPFLEPKPGPPFNFLQGVLTALDLETGANTVDFGGGITQSDLPVIGDPAELTVNDIVMVLQLHARYFILGPITSSPAGGSGWAVAFGSTNPTTNSTSYTSLAGGDILGVAFTAPASGSVEILVQGWLALSSATLGRRALMSPQVREGNVVNSGTIVETANDDYAALAQNSVASSFDYRYVNHSRIVTGLTPGAEYNAVVMHRIVTAGDNSAANDRHIIVKPFG